MFDSLTIAERERLAYAEGFTETARLLGQTDDAQTERNALLDEVERLRDELRDLQRETQDYAEYRAFFEECFEHLAGHYPAPSVTSDYDKSVIFTAIDNAEGAA